MAYLLVLPILRYITPLFRWVKANLWFFVSGILFWYILRINNLDIHSFAYSFVEELKDTGFIWLLVYQINIGSYSITVLEGVVAALLLCTVVWSWEQIQLAYQGLKQVFGDCVLLSLWIYFQIFGKKDQAVICIGEGESKQRAIMWIFLIVVLAIYIGFNVFAQGFAEQWLYNVGIRK